MNLGLAVLMLSGLQMASASDLGALAANRRGIAAFQKEDLQKAYREFSAATVEDPDTLEFRLNLGVAYANNKEFDKALQEYATVVAEAGENRQLKFAAHFNTGIALSQKGDVPGALAAYQNALAIEPSSKEVKTNIELLWQAQSNSGNQGGQNQNQQNSNQNPSEQPNPSESPKDEPQQKPKPFDSQELTPETVRKILEELKAQEERVRSEHFSKGAKERPRDKQW